MRINNVSNINFSYNYEFHRAIQRKLIKEKNNSELARTLVAMDSQAMRCEDKIHLMEQTGKQVSQEYSDITDFLIELKNILALYIESILPDSDFAKNEYLEYSKEAQDIQWSLMKGWRQKLCKYMKSLFSEYGENDIAKAKEKQETKETKSPSKDITTETILEEVAQQAVDEYKDVKAKGILEKYAPPATSPVTFNSVAGMDDIKLKLYENIIQYVNNPTLAEQDYEDYGIKTARGFLFYGPPGCGKTYITKALSQEAGVDMYFLDVSKVGSKYINETSNNIQSAFEFLKEEAKKSQKPIILFMDEVDSLAPSRGDITSCDENIKTLATLLRIVEESRENKIIPIAATNKYALLDEAFKARFDGQIYFPLPDENQIKKLLSQTLSTRKKGEKLSKSNEEIAQLAKALKGYSNRSIVFIVDEASKLARRNDRHDITSDDILKAIKDCQLEKSDEKEYKTNKNLKSVVGFY